MSYESFIKISLIVLPVLTIYFLKLNNRTVNLFGLTLGIIGTIFLVLGSFDSLIDTRWSKDKQPPSLKRDYKHLFEKNYGLNLWERRSKENDYLSQTLEMQAEYPVLRLIAAEFGPWLLFIAFVLQLYVVWIGP